MWDLPIQQSEVLKIGSVIDDGENMGKSQYWSSHSSKMTSLQESTVGDTPSGLEGLDFQRHCTNCGHAQQTSIFTPTPAAVDTPSKHRGSRPSSHRCSICKPRQPLPTKLPCVICGEVVDGMLVPCLNCGHVSCFECHRRWFLRPGDQFDSPFELTRDADTKTLPSCPTGCGCNCSEHVAADVSMPTWQPASPVTRQQSPSLHRSYSHDKRHRRRQSEPVSSESSAKPSTAKGGVGQNEEDLDLWQETSPFASLARGLGGGLSQGLRAKEERRKMNPSVAIALPKGK